LRLTRRRDRCDGHPRLAASDTRDLVLTGDNGIVFALVVTGSPCGTGRDFRRVIQPCASVAESRR
jgi:hypothetical protein